MSTLKELFLVGIKDSLILRTRDPFVPEKCPGYLAFRKPTSFRDFAVQNGIPEKLDSGCWLGIDVACSVDEYGINFASNKWLAEKISPGAPGGFLIAVDPKIHIGASVLSQPFSHGDRNWTRNFPTIEAYMLSTNIENPLLHNLFTNKADAMTLIAPDPLNPGIEHMIATALDFLKPKSGILTIAIDPIGTQDIQNIHDIETCLRIIYKLCELRYGSVQLLVNHINYSPEKNNLKSVPSITIEQYLQSGYPESFYLQPNPLSSQSPVVLMEISKT